VVIGSLFYTYKHNVKFTGLDGARLRGATNRSTAELLNEPYEDFRIIMFK